MILYDYPPLAECYAVRLLAALLDVPLEIRSLDYYPGREHETDEYLDIAPLGSVPALDTGTAVLGDWQAALIHLAAHHDATGQWLPLGDPDRLVAIHEWLAVARALAHSAGVARLHELIGQPAVIERCRTEAHRLLRHLERHLWFGERAGRRWLVEGEQPTIADIAVFVQVILCEEGGVSRLDYPAVRRWIDSVRGIRGFVVTSGVLPLDPTAPVHTLA
ncbi:glutathione S-transferase family protein [Novosphingobium aquimarinum]|uniref:glutathione S-transferase family protein n=1 Tax=Novosphingobium aquimarinum TaxID=2682494 RepID=UPI0012ECAC2B|nr:glutathione S-transferase [Novosphingobium aquimarinum]